MAEQQINYYDFAKMTIDLSKVAPGQSVIEVYPELQTSKAYTLATNEEIKVAIFMCDPQGPFKMIKRYDSRLEKIFTFLRLDAAGADQELYLSVLKVKNERVADIWTEYLSNVFDHEWVAWFSNSILYYQMMQELRKPINVNDDTDWAKKQKIEGRADAVYKRMKSMEELVFVDETIKKKAFEREKTKKENYAEKYADSNSVI